MKPADDIKRFFKNAGLTTDPAKDKAVFDKLLKASETKNKKPAETQLNIWRIIMQSKITKLTAAAAIILVGMIIVNQFGGSVDLATPAYAIEQTLEAMQHIETIHLFGKDWGNNEFEMWMQLNPITGIPEYVYADYYTIGALSISRPDTSYQYHKKSNRVQFNSGNLFTIDVAPAKMFEQLLQASKDQNNQEDINIYHESDTETGKTLIVIYYETPKTTMRFYIDPETKLPIRKNLQDY